MAEGRRYTDDEVRTILERALKRTHKAGVSHDELVAAAGEVGLSREDIERAAAELDEGRDEREARAKILKARRAGLAGHAWAYAGVNLFLVAINLITTPSILWFVFPLLGWGLGLFFHARAGLSKEVSERAIRKEVEKVNKERKKERKRLEEERRAEEKERKKKRDVERSSFEKGAAELGSAVEEGVGMLMSKLAEEIRGARETARRDNVRVAGDVAPDSDRRRREDDERAEAEAEEEAEAEREHRRRRR
jgi:hypothetical protein